MPKSDMINELEFLKWAYSDHLSNAQRGVLAEFIVGQAIGATGKPRVNWDQYDLVTPEGITVEVKSAAYVQSWDQRKDSVIEFAIEKKKPWDAETNTTMKIRTRPADVYVFSVLAEKERSKVNPLDLGQWFFLVASTEQLSEWFGDQKSVRLSVLEQKGLIRMSYDDLREAVARAV